MKNILTTIGAVVFLLGCSTFSQKQNQTPSQVQAGTQSQTEPKANSFEMRLKEAKKPFNFLLVGKMKVTKGMESEYLEVEKGWMEIHNMLVSQGKKIRWSLWKPEDNSLGYDYITVSVFDSRSSLDDLYNQEDIKKALGNDKIEKLFKKTPKTRTIVGQELWALDDWTVSDGPIEFDSLMCSFMTPAEGKESEYVELEKKYFSKFWQSVSDSDPNHPGWHLGRLLLTSGQKPEYSYYTLHLNNSKKRSTLNEGARKKIWEKVGPLPKDVNMNKLRKMKNVKYKMVMATDIKTSAVSQEWQKLQGAWKHTYPNGNYRVKRISPYKETLEFYSKDGKLQNSGTSPMKIEIKNGLKFFYSIHPNGTWRSIYHIKDGKWYEQLRGIFGETNAKPNDFLIYEKMD